MSNRYKVDELIELLKSSVCGEADRHNFGEHLKVHYSVIEPILGELARMIIRSKEDMVRADLLDEKALERQLIAQGTIKGFIEAFKLLTEPLRKDV